MTAFNFANEDEARLFRKILLEKMQIRKQKREGKCLLRRLLMSHARISVYLGMGKDQGIFSRHPIETR